MLACTLQAAEGGPLGRGTADCLPPVAVGNGWGLVSSLGEAPEDLPASAGAQNILAPG